MDLTEIDDILKDEKPFRKKQVMHAIFHELIMDWDEATALSKDIRENLKSRCSLGINAELFEAMDWVDVVGTSKGKGFQGVVKRHGFGGVGQSTHGQHNRLRAPGSLGASSYPSRVFKGMRMAGRTGGDTVTVQNLQVIKVIPEHNLVLIKGSVPGAKGSIVIINK